MRVHLVNIIVLIWLSLLAAPCIAQTPPQHLGRIVFYDVDGSGARINAKTTKVAGLQCSYPGGPNSDALAQLAVPYGTQLATFHLGVELSDLQYGTPEYHWSVIPPSTPAKLYIPSSQSGSPHPDGYCFEPGVFEVHCHLVFYDGQGAQVTDDIVADCAVIGGDLQFTLETVSPAPPDHEGGANSETKPFYLTHFGFGLTQTLPPGAQEQRDEVIVTPRKSQPDGTEMYWSIPPNFDDLMAVWGLGPEYCVAWLAATDHSSPAPVSAMYFLHFTGMWGDEDELFVADDTDSTLIENTDPNLGFLCSEVAVRKPADLKSHHSIPMTGSFPSSSDVDVNHTAAQIDDYMQVVDVDDGLPMPAIWVQERWNPDPVELTTNAETQCQPWLTGSAGADYGVFTTADHLGYMWPTLPATPDPLVLPQGGYQNYFAATSSTDLSAFGILVGLFQIEFHASTGGKWGVAIHVKH